MTNDSDNSVIAVYDSHEKAEKAVKTPKAEKTPKKSSAE